jgi:hypothetical protein
MMMSNGIIPSMWKNKIIPWNFDGIETILALKVSPGVYTCLENFIRMASYK